MIEKLKATVRQVLAGPADPHPLTLAVPDSRSTHDPGDVGWAHRPPAQVRCPDCGGEFVHRYGGDMIRCPRCRFEQPPQRFADLELLDMECPSCNGSLEYGMRHPHVFDIPQWASCPDCHYHWELQHSFSNSA